MPILVPQNFRSQDDAICSDLRQPLHYFHLSPPCHGVIPRHFPSPSCIGTLHCLPLSLRCLLRRSPSNADSRAVEPHYALQLHETAAAAAATATAMLRSKRRSNSKSGHDKQAYSFATARETGGERERERETRTHTERVSSTRFPAIGGCGRRTRYLDLTMTR